MTSAGNPPMQQQAEPVRAPTLRPRQAASLMLLDRSGDRVKVLMGRRAKAHVFMPNVYVFPGGRRDAGDHRLGWCGDMHPAVLDRLGNAFNGRTSIAGLRAIALAALRELHEETSLAIGTADAGNNPLPFLPDLTNLRYIARAITPPGLPRRFDTHFFALFTDEAGIDPGDIRDSQELEDLRWIDVNDVTTVEVARITEVILGDLRASLGADASLPFGNPVPFHYTRRQRFISDHF